jgi:hypothetical protein
MASQPSTQPVKVAKRQTTLLSFFKSSVLVKPPSTAILAASPIDGRSASAASPPVRRALDLSGECIDEVAQTVTMLATDATATRPQSPTDSDSGDDVPLSVILSRQTTSTVEPLRNVADAASRPINAPLLQHSTSHSLKRSQTLLDFGQAITSTTECPLCGMVYASHNATDEALHLRTCRSVATTRSGQSQKSFVDELFAGCDGDVDRPRRRGAAAHKRPRTPHEVHHAVAKPRVLKRSSSGKSLLQCLHASVPLTSSIRLVSVPCPGGSAASTQRLVVAVIDGNDAHVWGRLCPALVDHMVRPPVLFGPTFAWLANARRLAAKDAASEECYAEHRSNVRIVVALDADRGAPLAAVVGREAFREFEATAADDLHGSSRARTRCDVLQLWCAEALECPAGSCNLSRTALLFDAVIAPPAGPQKTFWSRFHAATPPNGATPTEAVTQQAPPVSLSAPEAALRSALEVLGKHVVYGCHVDWMSEVCYANDVVHHRSLCLLSAAENPHGRPLLSFDWDDESADIDPDAFLPPNDHDEDAALPCGNANDGESCCNSSQCSSFSDS